MARAFTFIEMMMTVAIIAIAALIALPLLTDSDSSYVEAAVGMFMADLDVAQTTAISQADEEVLVRLDTADSRWWVALSSAPDVPLLSSTTGDPYLTILGAGDAYAAEGVVMSTSNVIDDRIGYNAFGQLDQVTNPTITFSRGGASQTLEIDSELGFVRAVDP